MIVGAGGFGREVLDVINDMNKSADKTQQPWDFLGFIDDGSPASERLERLGATHLGGSESLDDLPIGTSYAIGIGSGPVRRNIDARASKAGLTAATLMHGSATMGADVEMGPGAVVCAGVRITTNVRVGRHVHLNINCTVGHDCVLEDYVTVNPLSAISGDVVLGQCATVGTNACINQGLTVGAGAMVASGSAVIQSVGEFSLVAGVPAVKKKDL